jgi:hypothetical protein
MTMHPIFRGMAAALALATAPLVGNAAPQTFDSPYAAVAAVIAALESQDRDALLAIFGPENEDVAFTGDAAKDSEIRDGFLRAYRERNRLDNEAGDRAVLHIGREDWPFPVTIVQGGNGWAFDAAAAREEVALRRIGLNELDVIDLLKAGVAVQSRFRQTDHDGDGVMEFADAILSQPGKRDGLYWPDEPGTEVSPIGPLMARASADGYNMGDGDTAPDPYLGYYFRILQTQGPDAPGGALDYLIGGNMVAGHAFLAYPADYGVTGVMSFMVGENGIVYEADLGPDTLAIGNATTAFNPGEGWAPAD